MHKLAAKNLFKRYKKESALNGVSLDVSSSQIVSLLGPNGAGKTTTFYIVCGLVSCDGGSVYLDDTDITSMPLHKKASLGISYLPQESSVFRDLTVEENLELACEIVYGNDEERIARRTEELLELLDIEPVRNRQAYMLSGGERRRVEIARALVLDPKFLLLDEPFAGVDPIAVAEIQSIILKLQQNGIGILLTDHNFREALEISSHVFVLKDGALLSSGTPQQIRNDELVQRYYLGENKF